MKYRFNSTYILEHPIEEYSAAAIVLDEILFPEEWEKASNLADQELAPQVKENDRLIEAAEAEELLRWMRKPFDSVNRHLLRGRLLSHEDELMEPIKRRILTTAVDSFIENATYFLACCTANPSDWIMEQYGNVRSPYMQSMLCLVLGVRGWPMHAQFLFGQVDRFEKRFPDSGLGQGPLLGLCEIEERCGRF